MVEYKLTLDGVKDIVVERTVENLRNAGFEDAAKRLEKNAEDLKKNPDAYGQKELKIIVNLCDELDKMASGKCQEFMFLGLVRQTLTFQRTTKTAV